MTEHFTLYEMSFSEYATRHGKDNTPNEVIADELLALCTNVLEPIRVGIGKPLLITSGYRSVEVNKAIGGSKTSQHCLGQAADFHISGMSIETLFQWIINSGIKFDQIIQEFDAWVHISYRGTGNRNMLLRAKKINGKTAYLKILRDV